MPCASWVEKDTHTFSHDLHFTIQKILGGKFPSQGVLRSIMAHDWLLIWIISGCCLGSTVFFHLFAAGSEGATVSLSFMSSCYLLRSFSWLSASQTLLPRQDPCETWAGCSVCSVQDMVKGPDPKWGAQSSRVLDWSLQYDMGHGIPGIPHGAVELCCCSQWLGTCWSLQQLCPHSCVLAGTWKSEGRLPLAPICWLSKQRKAVSEKNALRLS